MSGGMWCASAASFAFLQLQLSEISRSEAYLSDMVWLNERVWSTAARDVLQHDAFSCDKFGGGLPFPSVRVGWEHVGSVYIGGAMRQGDVDILRRTTPPPRCTPEAGGERAEAAPGIPVAVALPPSERPLSSR
jgi:hypothetical protein